MRGEGESSPVSQKFSHPPHVEESSPSSRQPTKFLPFFSFTIFILTSHSLCTQVMLILILIDFHYLQNVVFSFVKGLNGQMHYSSDSNHPIKKTPAKFPIPPLGGTHPHPLMLLENPALCYMKIRISTN